MALENLTISFWDEAGVEVWRSPLMWQAGAGSLLTGAPPAPVRCKKATPLASPARLCAPLPSPPLPHRFGRRFGRRFHHRISCSKRRPRRDPLTWILRGAPGGTGGSERLGQMPSCSPPWPAGRQASLLVLLSRCLSADVTIAACPTGYRHTLCVYQNTIHMSVGLLCDAICYLGVQVRVERHFDESSQALPASLSLMVPSRPCSGLPCSNTLARTPRPAAAPGSRLSTIGSRLLACPLWPRPPTPPLSPPLPLSRVPLAAPPCDPLACAPHDRPPAGHPSDPVRDAHP